MAEAQICFPIICHISKYFVHHDASSTDLLVDLLEQLQSGSVLFAIRFSLENKLSRGVKGNVVTLDVRNVDLE